MEELPPNLMVSGLLHKRQNLGPKKFWQREGGIIGASSSSSSAAPASSSALAPIFRPREFLSCREVSLSLSLQLFWARQIQFGPRGVGSDGVGVGSGSVGVGREEGYCKKFISFLVPFCGGGARNCKSLAQRQQQQQQQQQQHSGTILGGVFCTIPNLFT